MAKSVSKDEMMFRKTSSPPMGVSSFDDVELNSSSSGAVVGSEFGIFLSLSVKFKIKIVLNRLFQ